MGNFLNYNGNILPAGQEVQDRAARSCRSNDGLFETMRVHHDVILLQDYHFDRLTKGMEVLKLSLSQGLNITDLTRELCLINGHQPAARVRLTVFRGEHANEPSAFIIETWPLDPLYVFPEGLTIGVFAGGYKTADATAAFKTNYELYTAAANYAREQQWDDCLVLNLQGNICDASIANIFCVKDGEIATPPLSEGCIGGVMRRYLITSMQEKGFPVMEQPLTKEMLLHADEVFLTNVIRGIRPVRVFQGATYDHTLTKRIFTELVAPLAYS